MGFLAIVRLLVKYIIVFINKVFPSY